MRPREIRLQNLELLVAEFGSIAEVSRLANTSEKYLWQILNKIIGQRAKNPRGIGDDLAAKLERGCHKPPGWMDKPHQSQLPTQDQEFIHRVEEEVARYEVPDHVRQAIMTLITSSPKKS